MIESLLFLLLLLFLINAWMYIQQPRMLFFPVKELDQSPTAWGLEYEDISLDTVDGKKLHGWYLPHHESEQLLLFFHGNAGNISHRRESIEIFHQLGLNVLIFDYRGYGKSKGKPDEQGLYQDAGAAWRYLTIDKGIKPEQIIIFGRSLGGAVATKLAADVQPGALIVESTFSSSRDVARTFFPFLSRLVFMRFGFNTASRIQDVTAPVLVLHSPDDEIIPFQLGKKVYDSALQPKHFVTMQGDHNNGFLQSQPEYEQELAKFLKSLAQHVYSNAPVQ